MATPPSDHDHTRFATLKKSTPSVSETPEHLFVSKNDKTGWSINVAIAQTCHPTRACMAYCYGLGGRIVMEAALHRQAENAKFFAVREPWEIHNEAEDIVHEISRRQSFMRMFGVGDLQEGSVEFLSWMAQYARTTRPGFRIWTATRRFDLAPSLPTSPNLHVMLSFDATTPARQLAAGQALLARGPTWFAAWVRQSEDEVIPDWVSVVFEMHKPGRGRAKREPEPRACPATIHENREGVALAGACAQCRFCFDDKIRAAGPALVSIRRKAS